MRGNPIGFRVQRLNHSATVTSKTVSGRALTEGVRIATTDGVWQWEAGPDPIHTHPVTPALRPLPRLYATQRNRLVDRVTRRGGPPAKTSLGSQRAQSYLEGDGGACRVVSWREGAGPQGGG